MAAGLLAAAYERLTGRPYFTVGGHASRDFGPTPGAEVAEIFGPVGDAVALRHGDALLAAARRIKRERAAQLAEAQAERP